jgi:hypothetical protein
MKNERAGSAASRQTVEILGMADYARRWREAPPLLAKGSTWSAENSILLYTLAMAYV